MMKEKSLRFQLIVSFSLVALVMAAVGVLGYLGLSRAVSRQTQFATQYLPSVDSLWTVKNGLDIARRVELVALTPGLSDEEREAMKKNHAAALEQIREGVARFEGLARQPGLEESHGRFKESFAAWKGLNEESVSLALDRGDPASASAVAKGDSRARFYETRAALDELIEGVEVGVSNSREEFSRMARRFSILSVCAVLFGVLAALAMGVFLARAVGGILGDASDDLGQGAEQVTNAARELSNASESMASSSSEQAASLEETSSALEEMSAMTRRNADNAAMAKRFADSAAGSVGNANSSMRSMVDSMNEISRMGVEVGKIIKAIDEIAFQTNLLALNAAVEAARAGEAGAGFAVVADEVRNLAQRAAASARSTSDLIEGTTRRIREGTELVQVTNSEFQEVSGAVRKVAELVAEITVASQEQSRGIDEVTRAIAEMDKVTQGNAASAEEIASATEELSAQAMAMEEVVVRLDAIVEGRRAALHASRRAGEGRNAAPERPGRLSLHGTPSGTARTAVAPSRRPVAPIPEEEAPFGPEPDTPPTA